MSLGDYRVLDVELNDGVAEFRIVSPKYSERGHYEWSRIWQDIDDNQDVRVGLIVWAIPDDEPMEKMPKAPSREGGQVQFFADMSRMARNARMTVNGIVNCEKPIISAIRGQVRTGAGLAASLLADISVASETVVIADTHISMGVAAGDQGAFWPLLCGLAKAKRYLLLAESITGKEAERIGLVSDAVPDDEVLPTARAYAARLAAGPQNAISFTKRALNQWLKLGALTSFDYSLALEGQNFFDGDFDALMEAKANGTPVRYPSIDVRVPIAE